jgi:hypothetical protein
MNSITVAEDFLNKVCNIDNKLKNAMTDEATKDHVVGLLSQGFEKIHSGFPHLVEDIQRRIVKYHSVKGEDGKITDFIQLVDWYGMYLADKPTEYFDANGKYYGLRMSEVIDMFLIARFNC